MTILDHEEHVLRDYYTRRADEYERVYAKPERQVELRLLEQALPALFADRRGLELACGTGWWTPHAARDAQSWLATDVSVETLAIARSKPMPAVVRFEQRDAYQVDGLLGEPFDAVFAGFWWSHVPRQRLGDWLASLHAALPTAARVVMIDNCFVPGSSTPIARTDADGNSWQRRVLDDGSTHEVMKNFPGREEAVALLGPRARSVRWIEQRYFWLLSYDLA